MFKFTKSRMSAQWTSSNEKWLVAANVLPVYIGEKLDRYEKEILVWTLKDGKCEKLHRVHDKLPKYVQEAVENAQRALTARVNELEQKVADVVETTTEAVDPADEEEATQALFDKIKRHNAYFMRKNKEIKSVTDVYKYHRRAACLSKFSLAIGELEMKYIRSLQINVPTDSVTKI